MTVLDFKEICRKRIDYCLSIMLVEKEEYTRDGDKLHNFKIAGKMKGESPEKALWGMWVKHIVSIKDIIEDADKGIYPSDKIMNEKLSDNINYTLLLEGLLVEAKKQHSIT